MQQVFLYYPVMGLCIGMSLTTLIFMLVMRMKVSFPGREGVLIWSGALVMGVATQSITAITRGHPDFLRDVLLFASTYTFLHGFNAGFHMLQSLPRVGYPLRTGVLLTAAYAALLQIDDRFWVRSVATNLMQVGVFLHFLVLLGRFYISTERARFSSVLCMICVVMVIVGSLSRMQTAFDLQDAYMINGVNGPLDGLRQYVFTLVSMMFGSLGMLLGCFERLVEVARHAEMFNPLTGLLNPRPLKAAGERELGLALENGQGLALALVRIDGFKQMRLVQGEEAARLAMLAMAQALVPDRRLVDLAGNFHEDVLCVIAPGEEAPAALGELCIRRIRARSAVAGQRFTASVGVASLPRHGAPIEWLALVKLADQALEEAGAAGGDRLVVRVAGAPAPAAQMA